MQSRVDRLLQKMEEESLDSIVITDKYNINYFSGFTGTTAYLIILPKSRYLVTDFRYLEQAQKQCAGFEIIDNKSGDIKKLVKNCKRTGFENNSILYAQYMKLADIFTSLVPINDLLINLREIKDENEISNIKKAVRIADNAFSHIIKFAKIGMTEIEVADEIEFYMRKNGAEALSFDTIVASGKRGAMPHGFPSDKKIENGDLVVLDFGCYYNGYASDMTRTFAAGNVPQEMLDVYNTVKFAQQSVLDVICNGASCRKMHEIAQDIIDKKYPGSFGHALGHGVGLEIHELPTLSPKSEKKLEVGNVVSVEPGIYITDFCGVRIEDLVLITKENCEILTKSTKELIYIA